MARQPLTPRSIALDARKLARLVALVGNGKVSSHVRRGLDWVLADLECQARQRQDAVKPAGAPGEFSGL